MNGERNQSGLLALPREIRDKILGYVLSGHRIHVERLPQPNRSWKKPFADELVFLRCKVSATKPFQQDEAAESLDLIGKAHSICRAGLHKGARFPRLPESFMLLAVNQQLRGEGIEALIKESAFMITNAEILKMFLGPGEDFSAWPTLPRNYDVTMAAMYQWHPLVERRRQNLQKLVVWDEAFKSLSLDKMARTRHLRICFDESWATYSVDPRDPVHPRVDSSYFTIRPTTDRCLKFLPLGQVPSLFERNRAEDWVQWANTNKSDALCPEDWLREDGTEMPLLKTTRAEQMKWFRDLLKHLVDFAKERMEPMA